MDNQNSKPKRKGWLIALCIILGVLLALVIAATAFFESFLGLIKKPEEQEQSFITEEEYMQEILEEETQPEEEIPAEDAE